MNDERKMELVKYEFTHHILPGMLYNGSAKEDVEFISGFIMKKSEFMYILFNDVCFLNDTECPFTSEDYSVNFFNTGDIHTLQLGFPCDYSANDTLRAYLMFFCINSELLLKKYFITQRNSNGETFIIYIDQEGAQLFVENVQPEKSTERERNMVLRAYMSLCAQEINMEDQK